MAASILKNNYIIVLTVERIIQTMNDCKFSCQNKYSTLKRIDEHHLTKTDTILQGMDGSN